MGGLQQPCSSDRDGTHCASGVQLLRTAGDRRGWSMHAPAPVLGAAGGPCAAATAAAAAAGPSCQARVPLGLDVLAINRGLFQRACPVQRRAARGQHSHTTHRRSPRRGYSLSCCCCVSLPAAVLPLSNRPPSRALDVADSCPTLRTSIKRHDGLHQLGSHAGRLHGGSDGRVEAAGSHPVRVGRCSRAVVVHRPPRCSPADDFGAGSTPTPSRTRRPGTSSPAR